MGILDMVMAMLSEHQIQTYLSTKRYRLWKQIFTSCNFYQQKGTVFGNKSLLPTVSVSLSKYSSEI